MVLPRVLTLLVLLVSLTSCAQRGPRDGAGPARTPGPAPAAGMNASDAGLDAPAELTPEQRARLSAELEKLDMAAIGSGPEPQGQTSELPAPPPTTPPLAAPTPDGGTKVRGPRAVIQLAAAVGGPAGADAVLARARAGFRACYQRALAEDPETTGAITLTLRLGPDGNVTQATSATSVKFVSSLSSCLEARARVLKFAAPPAGSDKLVVTLTLGKD